MKQKFKDGDEWDAVGSWRKWYHWKPGQLKKIKNKMYRRIRRDSTKIIQQELEETKDD